MLACVRSAITCHSLHWQAWRGSHLQCTLVIKHKTFKDFCFDQQGGGLPKTFKKLKFLEFFCWLHTAVVLMLIYVLQPPYYAPPFLLGVEEGGVEPPTKFLKRGGGLGRISILRGGCWVKRGDFFQGVLQFFHKK